MNNTLIKMEFQESMTSPKKEVVVYDFFHNPETLESFALCWVFDGEYWLTAPVSCLSPIEKHRTLVE